MVPVLMRAADDNVARCRLPGRPKTSHFCAASPGLYVFLGVTLRDQDPAKAAPNHNPRFFVDESALVVGTRTLAFLAVNFLDSDTKKDQQRKKHSPLFKTIPNGGYGSFVVSSGLRNK